MGEQGEAPGRRPRGLQVEPYAPRGGGVTHGRSYALDGAPVSLTPAARDAEEARQRMGLLRGAVERRD
jgi:hypothetical protein